MRASTRSTASARAIRRTSSPPGDNHYIFVYGTLKKGERFHRELAKHRGVRFAGEARIRGLLFQLPDADYPGAVQTTQNKFIHGQLFSTDHPEKTLKSLDEFEGVDEGLFRRKMVDAWHGRKRTKAWAYFYAGSIRNASPLTNGVYS